jgi:enterochelin esterase-like enzyme
VPVKSGLLILLLIVLSLTSCASTSPPSTDVGSASSVPAVATVTRTAVHTTVQPSLAVPSPTLPVATVAATSVPLPTITPSPTATAVPDGCPYLRGHVERGSLQSTAMREPVRFLVHLPPCYHEYESKAFPVLYLFHGWPMNEWHWDTMGIDEWRDDWISRGLSGPFLIVLPGVGSDGRYVHSSGGDSSFEGFVVNELVPYVDATYRTITEPQGRAVGGISRGGVWALEIAMRHQELFGSVGGHSPALSLNRPLPQYDPYLLARQDVSGLRFYLDAGNLDWASTGTIRLRDVLLEAGADVTYQVHTGGHVDALWESGIPDYIAFYSAAWPSSYAALPAWEGGDVPHASLEP